MDVINLAQNEKDLTRDFSLTFVGVYIDFEGKLEWSTVVTCN